MMTERSISALLFSDKVKDVGEVCAISGGPICNHLDLVVSKVVKGSLIKEIGLKLYENEVDFSPVSDEVWV